MEYVLYYVHSIEFDLLNNIFLIQLKFIYNRYQKSYIIKYQLFKNLVFYLLYLILYKNQQFVTYIEKYNQVKITKKINQLTLNLRFRTKILNIFSKSFKSFLYIKINKKHQKYILFTQSLICIYVNSLEIIINNSNTINFYSIFSCMQ